MSKLSFRARALDASKPMPIYMAEELPDLPDYSAINRAVPQMPSGMEKEEECEHHLQRAICAGLIIPTPEVSDIPDKDVHDKLYPANYKQPRQLIHMQPFTMEQDIPDYDMDSEDERWLEMQAKQLDLCPLKFEEMMDRLEKSSGQTVVKIQEAKALLKEDDDLINAVFDYWLNKRLKLQHPLILAVKTEHRTGTAVNNPYLAFRRRTEKMQTRKNRKNDETSYEKMLKLRRDLSRAVTLLELVKKREKMKREFVHLTVEVFEKRYQAKDFSGAIVNEVSALKTPRPAFTPIFHNHYTNQSWTNKAILKDDVIPRKEKRQYKKRKHKSMGHNRSGGLSSGVMDSMGAFSSDEEPITAASPEPEEVEDEGQFAFHRNKNCNYHNPLQNEGNWSWCSKEENGQGDTRFRYTLGSLSNPRRCVGFVRRRVGRGGRVILDRLSNDIDDFWQNMDYTVYDSTKSTAESIKQETSLTNTNSFTNLDLDNGLRTDIIKSEPSAQIVRTSSVIDVFSESGDNKCVIKIEPAEDTCNTGTTTRPVHPQEQPPLLHKEPEQDDFTEYWKSIQREWLHFRPKTPPPDYSPPCHLLPPDDNLFLPSANTPFSLELKPLDDINILTESSFITSPFLLDYDISMDVPVTDTRQHQQHAPSTNHHQHNSETLNTLNDGFSPLEGEVIGCSRFSVREEGAAAASSTPSTCASRNKRQCFVSSTLTSLKLNSVNNMSDVRPKAHNMLTTSTVNHPTVSNANGLLTQFGIEVPSGNKARNNKIHSDVYSNSVGSLSQNTISLLTSARTVTLNSHSANILEIPMSNDTDKGKGAGQREPGSTSPNNKTKTIVRKNNLVMEVT